MNVNDSEVVLAVLAQAGYGRTDDPAAASVILCNTCAIRENAEAKVRVPPPWPRFSRVGTAWAEDRLCAWRAVWLAARLAWRVTCAGGFSAFFLFCLPGIEPASQVKSSRLSSWAFPVQAASGVAQNIHSLLRWYRRSGSAWGTTRTSRRLRGGASARRPWWACWAAWQSG